jgi:hypothetical protein
MRPITARPNPAISIGTTRDWPAAATASAAALSCAPAHHDAGRSGGARSLRRPYRIPAQPSIAARPRPPEPARRANPASHRAPGCGTVCLTAGGRQQNLFNSIPRDRALAFATVITPSDNRSALFGVGDFVVTQLRKLGPGPLKAVLNQSLFVVYV